MTEVTKKPTSNTAPAFRSVLGSREVWSLAFGAMIGWGWVVMSGEMIDKAGSLGSILAVLAGAVMVGFVGLIYAELTPALPRAGGELGFSILAFGPNISWMCGWALLLAYVAISAFEAAALPTVVNHLAPNVAMGHMYEIEGEKVYLSLAAIGVIGTVVIAAANWVGVKTSTFLQGAATLGLLAVGIAFFVGSNATGHITNLDPLWTNTKGFLGVLVMTPFLFVGFDVIPQAAEEIKLPPRRIGKLILLSIAMAALWYALVQWGVGLVALKPDANQGLRTVSAMSAAFNSPWAGKLLLFGGILGILTSWNAFFIGGTRLVYAMARGRMLPAWLAKLHPQHKTPINAILFVASVTIIAPFFGKPVLLWVINAGSLATVMAYFLVALAFLKLRRTAPQLPRPFKVSGGTAVGMLTAVITFGFIFLYLPGSPAALKWPNEWAIVLVWIVFGIVFFLVQRQKNTGLSATEQQRLILGEHDPHAASQDDKLP